MFKSTVLLTGAVEVPHLTEVLHRETPSLPVFHAVDPSTLRDAVDRADPPVLLLAYCTNVIVPTDVINAIEAGGGRAYNFHPAPPAYPGVGGPQRAILDDAESFGVTAHELTKDVDGGPIVGVLHFPVPDGITGTGLEERAYRALFELFMELAPVLLSEDGPYVLRDAAWDLRSLTRAELEELKANPPADRPGALRHTRAFS